MIIFFIFLYLFSSVPFKNKINVEYEDIEVCGKVERFTDKPNGGGYTTKKMFFQTELFGFVYYDGIGMNYKISGNGINFLGLDNKKRICFLVNKPVGSKEWSNSYTIVEILKIED